MHTCFVIQPFDGGGRFDKRYNDVFAEAISEAGLNPYRVDKDPKVSVPIEDIEKEISAALVCFADITLDNPNVWFELGFAIASRKPVCIVCSKERTTPFPFDIRHRAIIEYDYASPSDFRHLQEKITARLKSIVDQEVQTEQLGQLQPTLRTGGLAPHEVSALAIIVGSLSEEGISFHFFQQRMQRAGFTETAAGIAVVSLKRRGMIMDGYSSHPDADESWTVFLPMEEGIDWLIENQDSLDLRRPVDPQSDTFF